MRIPYDKKAPVVILLPPEPNMGEQLEAIIQRVAQSIRSDLVLDFSNIDEVASTSIARLIQLQPKIEDDGGRMVLCHVSPAVRSILTAANLSRSFKFADDRRQARVELSQYKRPCMRAIWP